jgi:hypothetical protein
MEWQMVEDGAGNLVVTTSADTLTGTRSLPGERSDITLAATNEPITFSGEMTTCDEIILDIDQLPFFITMTRQPEPPPCPAALPIANASLVFGKLGGTPADETLVGRGAIQLPANPPASTSVIGAQLLIEDLGAGSARIVDVTHLTRPIPSLSEETCFAKGEGWRRETYKSIVRPGDPAECTLGTAKRFTAKFKRVANEVEFTFRIKRASIQTPVGPLRLTVVLGSSAGSFAAATCGLPQPTLTCTSTATGARCS